MSTATHNMLGSPTGNPEAAYYKGPDGGVALGVSVLFIQAHLSLKCLLRHLHHPKGRPGWCYILTEYVAL